MADYQDLANMVGYEEPQKAPVMLMHRDDNDANSQDAFVDPKAEKTQRRFSQRPMVRIAFVGGAALLIALVVGAALSLFLSPVSQPDAVVEEVPEETDSLTMDLGFDDSEKEAEFGKMQGEVALQRQQSELDSLVPFEEMGTITVDGDKVEPESEDSEEPDAQASTAQRPSSPPPRPSSRSVRRTPVPPPPRPAQPVAVAPLPPPRQSTALRSNLSTDIDPQEQWIEASNVGVIGFAPPGLSSAVASPAVSSFRTSNRPSFSAVSGSSPAPPPPPPSQPIATPSVVMSSQATVSPPPSRSRGDSFSGMTFEDYYGGGVGTPGLSSDVRRQIAIGTTASAVTVSPAFWPGDGSSVPSPRDDASPKYVAQLEEDLLDTDGETIMPKGTQLIFGVVPLEAETGVATLDVIGMIRDGSFYEISPNSMHLRGKRGEPIVAQRLQDIGGDIFAMDLGLFAVAGLAEFGRIVNSPESETITDTQFRGTVSRERGDTNFFGAVLEGGAGAIADRMAERNDEAIEEMIEQPKTWFLDAGTELQLFINQEISL